jgi:hypothetical protein
MVCFRYIIVSTLHKGVKEWWYDDDDDDDDDSKLGVLMRMYTTRIQ